MSIALKAFNSMPIVLVLLLSIPLTVSANASWPMFHQNPQCTGVSSYFRSETPDILWILQVVDYQVPSVYSVIAEDGTIIEI